MSSALLLEQRIRPFGALELGFAVAVAFDDREMIGLWAAFQNQAFPRVSFAISNAAQDSAKRCESNGDEYRTKTMLRSPITASKATLEDWVIFFP